MATRDSGGGAKRAPGIQSGASAGTVRCRGPGEPEGSVRLGGAPANPTGRRLPERPGLGRLLAPGSASRPALTRGAALRAEPGPRPGSRLGHSWASRARVSPRERGPPGAAAFGRRRVGGVCPPSRPPGVLGSSRSDVAAALMELLAVCGALFVLRLVSLAQRGSVSA